MNHLATFLADCDAVASRMGIARATLATRLFSDGKRLDALAAGADVGVRRLERAQRDLEKLKAGITAPPSDVPTLAAEGAHGAGKNDQNVSRTGVEA